MSITHFTLFGERHSCTNYFKKVVQRCTDLEYTGEYGWKHWFIKDFHPRGEPNLTTDRDNSSSIHDDHDHVLFFFIVRDVDSWVSAMQKRPHHAEAHAGLPLDEFVRKPWMSYEQGGNRVNWEKKDGVYFIEKSDNIITLRNEKNNHFYALKDKVTNFALIRSNFIEEDMERACKKFHVEFEPKFPTFIRNEYPPIAPETRKFIDDNLDNEVDNTFTLI